MFWKPFPFIVCLMGFGLVTPVFAQHRIEASTPLTMGRHVEPQKNASDADVEIGTLFGFSYVPPFSVDSRFDDGDRIEVPGLFQLSVAPRMLYLSWFPSERFAIRPEFSFSQFWGDNITTLYLGGQSAFFPRGHATSGPYILGRGGRYTVNAYNRSESRFSVGTGIGYRWCIDPAFVLRTEARYRRSLGEWSDEDGFSLIFGLGTKVGEVTPGQKVAAPEVEIGTLFGLSHLRSTAPWDDAVTMMGVPWEPELPLGDCTLYLSWFPSERLAIGPEFNLVTVSSNGYSTTSFYLGGQGAFFPKSNAKSGPYILGRGGLLRSFYNDPERKVILGTGIGYRWCMGLAFILRMEARYQRLFGEVGDHDETDLNIFSLLFGIGTRLGW